jgi:hypothetical protein
MSKISQDVQIDLSSDLLQPIVKNLVHPVYAGLFLLRR